MWQRTAKIFSPCWLLSKRKSDSVLLCSLPNLIPGATSKDVGVGTKPENPKRKSVHPARCRSEGSMSAQAQVEGRRPPPATRHLAPRAPPAPLSEGRTIRAVWGRGRGLYAQGRVYKAPVDPQTLSLTAISDGAACLLAIPGSRGLSAAQRAFY